VDAAFMAGSSSLRFTAYAVVHSGMGISLGIFLVGLWRSLSCAADSVSGPPDPPPP
jgi:hypothetical protein